MRNYALILADEIYALSTYDMNDFTSLAQLYPEGAFVTNGLSKDRSAGGYRLGSCILPQQDSDRLVKDFTKVAATVYTNVSTPTQYAAVDRNYSAISRIPVVLTHEPSFGWVSIPESASLRFRKWSVDPNSHLVARSVAHFPGFEHTTPSAPRSNATLSVCLHPNAAR